METAYEPIHKLCISQLCTKFWSRLGVSVSLHLSKAWGHLTLIETNLNYSDLFGYPDFFSSVPGFLWVSISRIQDTNNFFPPKKLNSPNEKELQDVISRLKVFFSDETDRIPSHILTSTFMSHSVSVYLLYHTCFCVFLFCTRVS